MLIAGSSLFERRDGEDLHNLLVQLSSNAKFINSKENWNGFNILHKEVGNIGALELGLKLSQANKNKNPKLVYLLECDDFDSNDIPSDAFVIYQGTHGDKGASRADIILPGATYLEKSGTYVSTEGRPNTTRLVNF
jgi:NADH dehydrogenase (ubiquinone) Fe-S protein 1